MNVDDCIDLFDDELEDFMGAKENLVAQRDNHLPFDKIMVDFVKEEEHGADSIEHITPLQGV
jgi:hypothetical protein